MKKSGKIALGVCLGVAGVGGIVGGVTYYVLNKKKHSSDEYQVKFTGEHFSTKPKTVKFKLNEEIKFTYEIDEGYVLDIDNCKISIDKQEKALKGYVDETTKTVIIPKKDVTSKSIEIHFETVTESPQFTPTAGGIYQDRISSFEPIYFELNEDIVIPYTIENNFVIDQKNSWISIGDIQQRPFNQWNDKIVLTEGPTEGNLRIKGDIVTSKDIEVVFYPIGQSITPNINVDPGSTSYIEVATQPTDCHLFDDITFTWESLQTGYVLDIHGSTIAIGQDQPISLATVIDNTKTTGETVVIDGQHIDSENITITIKAIQTGLTLSGHGSEHIECPETFKFTPNTPISFPYDYKNVDEGYYYELDLEQSTIKFGEGDAESLLNSPYVLKNKYIDIPADKATTDITLNLVESNKKNIEYDGFNDDIYQNSLWFKASLGSGKFKLNNYGDGQNVNLKYSIWPSGTGTPSTWATVEENTEISFNFGDLIYLRGDNSDGWSHNGYGPATNWKGSTISFYDTNVTLIGNVMGLIDDGQCSYSKEIPNDYCFSGLFACPEEQIENDVGGIFSINPSTVFPATNLKKYCYDSMFLNQKLDNYAYPTNLLPAEKLVEGCYYGMFRGCESLNFAGQTAPELKVENLENANSCYSHMFEGCTSLTEAPELPATTLSNYCYYHMFENTGLTSAPNLTAETLCTSCYENMFYNCPSLKILEDENSQDSMFYCLENPTYKCELMFGGSTQRTGFDPLSDGTPTQGKYYHCI